MKIIIDLTNLAPACRYDLQKGIVDVLRRNSRQIREDLRSYPEGANATKDMQGWAAAADAQLLEVTRQFKEPDKKISSACMDCGHSEEDHDNGTGIGQCWNGEAHGNSCGCQNFR